MMHLNHSGFSASHSLRQSLKRGMARQAISGADRLAPDLPALFRLAATLRPNPKGSARLAARLMAQTGVVQAAPAAAGRAITFTARAVREVEAQQNGAAVFRETGLIYLRARIGLMAGNMVFGLVAISFCAHALERLVERSDHPLDQPLLPAIDASARQMFRAWDSDRVITDADDQFLHGGQAGLWAGGFDEMAFDPDWRLFGGKDARIPIFSARTYLGPDEMRPTLWMRWRDDPACRLM